MNDIKILEVDGDEVLEMNDDRRIFKLDIMINKNEDGRIQDVILKAQKQGEAEFFCITFVRAVLGGRGGVSTTKKGILFFNDDCPFQPARIFFPLGKEDLKKIQVLFNEPTTVVQDMRPQEIGIKISQLQ